MSYREHPAPPALRASVEAVWSLWPDAAAPHRVLPDGAVDIVLVPGRAPVVAGPATRHVLAAPVSGAVTGVRLRPGAVPALFGIAAWELRDTSVPLASLIGDAAARRLETDAPLTAAHTLLAARSREAGSVDPLVHVAVAALRADPGLDVTALARRVALSERQLRRRFHRAVGYGPKRLARVLRLQRLLAEAGRQRGSGGAELAFAAGYADQPHMAREVRALAGVGPTALLAERGRFLQA